MIIAVHNTRSRVALLSFVRYWTTTVFLLFSRVVVHPTADTHRSTRRCRPHCRRVRLHRTSRRVRLQRTSRRKRLFFSVYDAKRERLVRDTQHTRWYRYHPPPDAITRRHHHRSCVRRRAIDVDRETASSDRRPRDPLKRFAQLVIPRGVATPPSSTWHAPHHGPPPTGRGLVEKLRWQPGHLFAGTYPPPYFDHRRVRSRVVLSLPFTIRLGERRSARRARVHTTVVRHARFARSRRPGGRPSTSVPVNVRCQR